MQRSWMSNLLKQTNKPGGFIFGTYKNLMPFKLTWTRKHSSYLSSEGNVKLILEDLNRKKSDISVLTRSGQNFFFLWGMLYSRKLGSQIFVCVGLFRFYKNMKNFYVKQNLFLLEINQLVKNPNEKITRHIYTKSPQSNHL